MHFWNLLKSEKTSETIKKGISSPLPFLVIHEMTSKDKWAAPGLNSFLNSVTIYLNYERGDGKATTIQVHTKILIIVKQMLLEDATGTLSSLQMSFLVPSGAASLRMCGGRMCVRRVSSPVSPLLNSLVCGKVTKMNRLTSLEEEKNGRFCEVLWATWYTGSWEMALGKETHTSSFIPGHGTAFQRPRRGL